MPTKEQLESALRNADASGDFKAAKQLANALKQGQYDQPVSQVQQQATADPNQYLRELAAEQSPLQATAIAMGKGLYDIGRGLGLVEPADDVERRAYEALKAESPVATTIGEVGGQALPFLPFGAAAGAIPSMAVRAPVMAGLGATEGALISAGTGGSVEENIAAGGVGGAIAGATELAFPVLGRVARQIYGRVKGTAPTGALITPDGLPTEDMVDALNKAGLTWEGLKSNAQDFIAKQQPGASPEEVARLAGFEQIGAPALAGEVSRDLAQRKTEQQLLESVTESVAEPVRQTVLRQSQAIKGELDNIVDNLGVTGDTGQTMKEALSGRRKLLKAERKTAYDNLAKEAQKGEGIPIVSEPILDALPDRGTIRDIASMAPNQYKALNDLLIEYGLEQGEEAVQGAAQRGIEISPLGIDNFESFRKRLGNIERSDATGATGVLTGPLRRALDAEVDMLTDSLSKESGGAVAEAAKAARQANVALKTEFDEAKITSKLIDSVKRGSTQPKVEASKAYQKVMAPNEPIENLDRVLSSLGNQGAAGQKAIQEMQGRAVMDLIDSAFSAQSRQVSGERIFGATPFSKQYEKLLPKLEKLFENDPKSFDRIKNVYERSQDIIPPSGAVPKGSAGFFIDALNQIGVYSVASKVPFARELFEIARGAGESAAKRKQVEKAINAKPKVKAVAQMIDRDYPQLAAAIGIAGFVSQEENESP